MSQRQVTRACMKDRDDEAPQGGLGPAADEPGLGAESRSARVGVEPETTRQAEEGSRPAESGSGAGGPSPPRCDPDAQCSV